MAQGDIPVTVVGNMVADPELRFTSSGVAVANFRVASTPRKFNSQTNQWEDDEAVFIACNVWRQQAENVSNSLTKGMRIIVTGRLKQRTWEDKEGNRRSVMEIDVEEVAPSLRYATTQVNRNPREGQQGGGGFNQQGGFNQSGSMQQAQQNLANAGFGQQPPQQGNQQADPWANAPTEKPAEQQAVWGNPAPVGQDGEPPF